MSITRRLLDAANIVSGLATVGGVLGWLAGMTWRFLFRRPVPFAEWVLHGAGFLGGFGLVVAIGYVVV